MPVFGLLDTTCNKNVFGYFSLFTSTRMHFNKSICVKFHEVNGDVLSLSLSLV